MKPYRAPELRALGSLSSLTLGRMGSWCPPKEKGRKNGGPVCKK